MAKGTDERIRELERSLARDPGDHAARLALARELARARRRDEAAAQVERVLRADPLHADAVAALDDHGLSPLVPGSPWPTPDGGGDRARRGLEPGARRGELTRRVRIGSPTGGRGRGGAERVLSLSVGGDGAVYLATDLRRLVALDLASGLPRWVRDLENPFAAPAVGAGERLLLASGDTVRLLDGRSGETLWIARSPGVTGQPVPASAAFAPRGLVLVAGVRGVVAALDAATGRLRWTHATRGALDATPAVDSGTIFVACCLGTLTALDLEGRPAGVALLPRAPTRVVLALEDAVYVAQDLAPPSQSIYRVARTPGGIAPGARSVKLGSSALVPACAPSRARLLALGVEPAVVEGERARPFALDGGLVPGAVADSAGCVYGFESRSGDPDAWHVPGDRLVWLDPTGRRVASVRDVRPGPIAIGPDATLLVPSDRGVLQVIA